MPKVMSNNQFVEIAKEIATNYKTLYVMGCFGAPMNSKNKTRYVKNNSYNKQSIRVNKIKTASENTFGFDCVCLIKGILWGWNGDVGKTYGGAIYKANGVPDVGADKIMTHCTNVTKDFAKVEMGELVHMPGHVGIYIGDGLVVESTPIWQDGVQITSVGNIGEKEGYNTRYWKEHGKLEFIDYSKITDSSITDSSVTDFSNTYTVVKGDTLSGIAKKLNISSWRELYNKNKAVIGNNPNLIKPGQVLKY